LAEQTVLRDAQAGGGELIMEGKINDNNFKDWLKMQVVQKTSDGNTITVHYWKNPVTGETKGFKFTTKPVR
jgi:hypothetical protein